ncbi:MAG: hypothetical protein N2379_10780, partial [Verrucomicrobiae bacterium]|nr:hypothetical protein [Verrucomicrobiae bacterium]
PTRDGLEGDLLSRDQRFHWQFARNACIAFYDTRYFAPSFRYQDDKASALAKIPSKINKKEATAIARDALHKLLGMTEKKLGYKTPPEVNQYKYQDTNGRVYPLPLFDVRWRKKGPKEYAAANLESFALYMEVSGVTCGVVKYHHPELLNKDAPIPRDPLPTNYFQMLGLPESYPDSVPERQSRLRGFTSSTNAASPITNTTR